MVIDANNLDFRELNKKIKSATSDVTIENCCGQRFIGTSLNFDSDCKVINIKGIPGNALGSYIDGTTINVHGNVQDAVGDTMNDGKIIVRGNAGDALGYSARGGKIFVEKNSGYRTGIHMKQYKDKKPTVVVGGSVGSFLGEYLAGGLIIVLGIGAEGLPVGDFIANGMHGGEIYIRSSVEPKYLPKQVSIEKIKNIDCIKNELKEYADIFDADINEISKGDFYKLTPDASNPYKQLYTIN